jgi:hypothetical protein
MREKALQMAVAMLEAEPGLEVTSALKEAGRACGVPWGDRMAEFVAWAERRLGLA